MTQIDLGKLTSEKSKVLAGHLRGVAARELYELDQLEAAGERIAVLAPKYLETISPSFVQGFLGDTVAHAKPDEVERMFDFSSLPPFLRDDFRIGLERLFLRYQA